MRRFTATIPASRRPTSTRRSRAWRLRSAATPSAGRTDASTTVARVADKRPPNPPGTRAASMACSRHTAWVRRAVRLWWRSASIRRMDRWSSVATGRRWRWRSAAMAAERASLGSFFDDFPDPSTRTRADSTGGTSTTSSPAATSCWASRQPSPPAPSTAQVRAGQPAAHATSLVACAAGARTRTCPSSSSSTPIATAVCESLCGSTPIITTAITGSSSPRERERPWRHA